MIARKMEKTMETFINHMAAVAMAEEGEVEMARKILKEPYIFKEFSDESKEAQKGQDFIGIPQSSNSKNLIPNKSLSTSLKVRKNKEEVSMEKIVFVEQVEREPKNIPYALEIAKNKGAKLSVLFLIPVVLETVDWIEVQEKQIREKEEKISTFAKELEEKCQKKGLELEWKVIQYRPRAFMQAMKEFFPAELIIVGDVDLKPLAEEGIKNLEDISLRMRCPVLSIKTLIPPEKTSKAKIFTRMAVFGALSALSYFVFFPQIDKLNHTIYMTGTFLGALAVLVTVPLHAYIYGSFTECIPKLLGLEKSAGSEH